MTSNNLFPRQARDELDSISAHINGCCSCATCPAQYPVETLHVLLDLIEKIDHRSALRYQLTQAVLSGLNINVADDGPTPPGVVLDQMMRAEGLTNRSLAARTNKTAKTINDLRRGNILPSPIMARALENVGLQTAGYWNRLTVEYKDWQLRQKEKQ